MFRELKKNIEIKFGKPIRFQRDIKEYNAATMLLVLKQKNCPKKEKI